LDKDIVQQAQRINALLKDNETIKQYQALKADVLAKYELDDQQLIELQQDLVNATQATSEVFAKKKAAYLTKKEALNNSPLVKEYLRVYQEYQALIMDIKEQLEK
jgi:cell fate (sporulation/competence/biofilm development) regulator YmcA (YheA/YmcA/DUF963 family)